MGMAGAGWKMRDGCRVRAKTAPVAAVSAPPVFFGVGAGDSAATVRRRWGQGRYSESSGLLTDPLRPQGVNLWQSHDAIF